MKNSQDVEQFMARLDHPRKAEIESVRATIRGVDERIRESMGQWVAQLAGEG